MKCRPKLSVVKIERLSKKFDFEFTFKNNSVSSIPHPSDTACRQNSLTISYYYYSIVFSERELTFTFAICCRPSVCRLFVCRLSSVTFVCST